MDIHIDCDALHLYRRESLAIFFIIVFWNHSDDNITFIHTCALKNEYACMGIQAEVKSRIDFQYVHITNMIFSINYLNIWYARICNLRTLKRTAFYRIQMHFDEATKCPIVDNLQDPLNPSWTLSSYWIVQVLGQVKYFDFQIKYFTERPNHV